MRSSQISLKRSLLLTTVAALSLFSTAALAQGNNKPTTTPSTSTDPKAAATPTATTSTPTGKDQKTTSSTSSSSTSSSKLPGLSSSTSTSTTSTDTGPPRRPTGLPTLSKTVDTSVPTYPPPSPPPVQDAPFMNRSTLPDGTVFIAVGAILGLFGAAILLWRGIVAFLLKRSVERAAMAQHTTNDKVAASFPAPPDTFYKYTDESSASLTAGLITGRGQRRTNRGPIPSQTPSTTNLFFSPTAAGGAGGAMSSANRHSSFLPSGFYAATSAAPAAGHGHSVSLSNLNPASSSNRHSQHVPLRQSSPDDSPELAPQRTTPPHHHTVRGGGNNFSTSSISLNRPPSGRAPSAYLEDLLDEQPGAFPPAQPQGPGHLRGYSNGQQPRF